MPSDTAVHPDAMVLVTGASGYLGGRLVPQLLAAGHRVRCLVRDVEGVLDRGWYPDVEVVRGDALEPGSLDAALTGVDTAYYLIHSMNGGPRFAARDRLAAENFRTAAERQGVRRIIYLGGLGDPGTELSAHLASRQEVGRILGDGPVAVTEVRAAVIIGSGSVSFEMLRHLTEVLPAMITPSWVRTRCQPIAVKDILSVLTRLLGNRQTGHQILEVGGPDVLSYQDMMQVYAEVAGLRQRLIIPVSVLSPSLSSRWVGLVTPVPTRVARTLIDSLTIEVVVADNAATRIIGSGLTSYRQAVSDALERVENHDDETRWSEAVDQPAARLPTDPAWAGARWLRNRKVIETTAPLPDVFWAITRIGGEVGYYAAGWAWRLRGLIDRWLGGVGLRRSPGPRGPLKVGDAVDFWRVADLQPDRRLLLVAEMRLPGEAWLEFEIAGSNGHTRLTQTAHFAPRGLWGRLYWFLLLPFHFMVFGPMARRLVKVAERRTELLEPREAMAHVGGRGADYHGADYRGAVETEQSPAEVFDYMADFRNAAEWDPATVSISQTAGTGAGLGARYRLITRFMGRSVTLEYETIGFKPVDELVLAFKGGAVAGTDTITITSSDGSAGAGTLGVGTSGVGTLGVGRTRLLYSVEFDLRWRWLKPLAAPFFKRTADEALAGLARALGGSVVGR